MALTAHWIAKVDEMALESKAALVAFHQIEGSHNGKNLANIVLALLDRAGITVKVNTNILLDDVDYMVKVGHFTMDNGSNNNTMMRELEHLLKARDIPFDAIDRRVMCFGHVVDLSSGRVIKKAGSLEAEALRSEDGESGEDSESGDALARRDPIALGRNVVRVIRASGARREAFNTVIENGNQKGLFKQGQPPQTITLKKLQLL
jgi:hypothetical protein